MNQQTQQQPTEPTQNDAAELATLRNTVRELKDKSASRKKRIAELESALVERDGKLAEATASLRAITIDALFRDMADSLSIAPELWIEQMQKLYRLERKDGALSLLNLDGTPTNVPFERQALINHLTDEKHPHSKTFRAITIISRASGSQAQPDSGQRKASSSNPAPFQFGLR